MQTLKRRKHTSRFVPDYMAKSLQDIDFKLLRKRGVRFIAFDADSTLVAFRGKALDNRTRRFLQKKRRLFKRWCIASNRITNDLLPLGKSIDSQVIRASLITRKPQRRFFDQVVKHFGAKPSQIAMIGDKLIADMWGAKRAGFVTVWVEHIGRDSLWDRFFRLRRLEKRLMRDFVNTL